MKSVSGKEFARVLERHDWRLCRVTGSHHVFTKAGSEVRLSVPIHGSKPMREGLLRHLMKIAGIAESDL